MKRYLWLLAIVALLGCSGRKESASLTNKLDSLLRTQVDPQGPGGVVLIAKGDSVVFAKGYGLADLTTREPVTTQTLFNLGSISKTFVAHAILILQQEQKLSVEDDLLRYFPNFKDKALAERVKIKHLLTHTSGLPDNRRVSEDSVFYLTAKDIENWYPVTQADSLLFEPGSRFEYSNPAYNGLALIIEQVTGAKWQQFVTERILMRSGMTTSTITHGPHPESGVSHGYVKVNGLWVEDDYGEEPTFAAAGNGGVWSSAEELLQYELALQRSTFLPADVMADARTVKTFPEWKDSSPPFIGWSWFVEHTTTGQRMVGHTGTQGGFYCNYVTIPDKDLFFVMLFNFPCNREWITERVLAELENANWLE